jgi:hypothetical protein
MKLFSLFKNFVKKKKNDAVITMSLCKGDVDIDIDSSKINDTNFYDIPFFLNSVYSKQIKDVCAQKLISGIKDEYVKQLLYDQMCPIEPKDFTKDILWDCSESYKTQGLSPQDIEMLKEELELDEDDEIEFDEDDGPDEEEERELESRIGYANFDITPYVDIIRNCEGVDTFQQLSRYRFIIVIAKHWFTFTEIRAKLTKLLKLRENGV